MNHPYPLLCHHLLLAQTWRLPCLEIQTESVMTYPFRESLSYSWNRAEHGYRSYIKDFLYISSFGRVKTAPYTIKFSISERIFSTLLYCRATLAQLLGMQRLRSSILMIATILREPDFWIYLSTERRSVEHRKVVLGHLLTDIPLMKSILSHAHC